MKVLIILGSCLAFIAAGYTFFFANQFVDADNQKLASLLWVVIAAVFTGSSIVAEVVLELKSEIRELKEKLAGN